MLAPWSLLVVAAVAVLAPRATPAATCPPPPGADPRLAAVPAADRIAWLRARLEGETPAARTWSRTWGAVDGALTVGQAAAAPFAHGRAGKALLAGQAATSALGVVQILLAPITPADVPPGDGGCGELAALEASLEKSARNEALGSGGLAHVGNVAVNAALALAAGLADHRWGFAAVTFTAGVGLGEAQILTQPTGLVRDLARYRGGTLTLGAPRSEGQRGAGWGIAEASVGRRCVLVTLRLTF